jgi:hypothetical protein
MTVGATVDCSILFTMVGARFGASFLTAADTCDLFPQIPILVN